MPRVSNTLRPWRRFLGHIKARDRDRLTIRDSTINLLQIEEELSSDIPMRSQPLYDNRFSTCRPIMTQFFPVGTPLIILQLNVMLLCFLVAFLF